MTAPCTCANWEGKEAFHRTSFPPDQFETLEFEALPDYHGATPHRGRLRCVKCGATFSYQSELTSCVVTRDLEDKTRREAP